MVFSLTLDTAPTQPTLLPATEVRLHSPHGENKIVLQQTTSSLMSRDQELVRPGL